MSAFLVEPKTINRILTAVETEARQSAWFRQEFVQKLECDPVTIDGKDQLGKHMLDLNMDALGQRYGDKKQSLAYTYTPVLASPIQEIKSLQCWLYQCMEGDVPESKLFRFFDEVVLRRLMTRAIDHTTEYDQAEWA